MARWLITRTLLLQQLVDADDYPQARKQFDPVRADVVADKYIVHRIEHHELVPVDPPPVPEGS